MGRNVSLLPPWSRRCLRVWQWARYRAKRLAERPVHVHVEARWHLGDEVMTLPFYDLLRRHYPGARITVSVNCPELLGNAPGIEVNNDVGELDCDRHILARDDARCIPRLFHLCRRFRIPFDTISPRVQPPDSPVLAELPRAGRLIAYSAGAGWPCKSCTPDFFRAMTDLIRSRVVDAQFIELGKDCAKTGVGLDMTDRLTVIETAAVLARCALYIGPDSGLVHLALAVGISVVGLYGPVKPTLTFGQRANLLAVLSPAPCQGCFTDWRMETPAVCPIGIDSPSPAAYPCMKALTPEEVWRQAGAAIKG